MHIMASVRTCTLLALPIIVTHWLSLTLSLKSRTEHCPHVHSSSLFPKSFLPFSSKLARSTTTQLTALFTLCLHPYIIWPVPSRLRGIPCPYSRAACIATLPCNQSQGWGRWERGGRGGRQRFGEEAQEYAGHIRRGGIHRLQDWSVVHMLLVQYYHRLQVTIF